MVILCISIISLYRSVFSLYIFCIIGLKPHTVVVVVSLLHERHRLKDLRLVTVYLDDRHPSERVTVPQTIRPLDHYGTLIVVDFTLILNAPVVAMLPLFRLKTAPKPAIIFGIYLHNLFLLLCFLFNIHIITKPNNLFPHFTSILPISLQTHLPHLILNCLSHRLLLPINKIPTSQTQPILTSILQQLL